MTEEGFPVVKPPKQASSVATPSQLLNINTDEFEFEKQPEPEVWICCEKFTRPLVAGVKDKNAWSPENKFHVDGIPGGTQLNPWLLIGT